MKKVYVLNDGGHDYRDAERYGQLVFCTTGSVNKWDIAQMYRELSDALQDANPDDYILLSSLSSLCSVATALMVDRFREVHWLLYKDNQYIHRDLVLGDN